MGSEQLNREIAAKVAARSSPGLAAAALALGRLPTCPYPAHRETDWRLGDGPLVCGVCHPPAPGLDMGGRA